MDDHAAGILAAYLNGHSGRVYNLGANCEQANMALVGMILDVLERPHSLISHVTDRPGHDLRYAVDASRARAELGWKPQRSFENAFPETVRQLAEAFSADS